MLRRIQSNPNPLTEAANDDIVHLEKGVLSFSLIAYDQSSLGEASIRIHATARKRRKTPMG